MYQTALVTGASRGIGKALVEQLTGQGMRVFASGRDEAALQTLATRTGCEAHPFDLADPQQVLALISAARRSLGHIEVLINNAGFNSRKAALTDTDTAEFDHQYAVNLRAPYILCREVLSDMLPRKRGHIVNVVSTVAKRMNETMGIYTAMKQGLHGLTGVLMKEVQPHGIKVTAVYPGGVNTTFREVAKPHYMRPGSVAAMIVQTLTAPDDVVVHDLTFRPPAELE